MFRGLQGRGIEVVFEIFDCMMELYFGGLSQGVPESLGLQKCAGTKTRGGWELGVSRVFSSAFWFLEC